MNQFFLHYITNSHIVIFALCFSFFEKIYKEKLSTVFLFLLLLLVGVMVGYWYTPLDLLVLFVLFFVCSYLRIPNENPMQIILSIMCAALIEMISTPLCIKIFYLFLNVGYNNEPTLLPFITIVLSLIPCVYITLFLRDKFFPFLKRKGQINLVSFILMILVLSYQTIEMIKSYAENQHLFFMFLIFYFLLSSLIIIVVRSLLQNTLLETEAKNDKIIADLQKQYVDEVKKQYQEIRKFRHDHANLLSTIYYFLETNKITELQDFFYNDMMKTNDVLKKNDLMLDSLQNIESLGIRSIFYTKLLLAQKKNIDIHIEINDFIHEEKTVEVISMVRLLGIFLDNAIEELDSIKEGTLAIVSFKDQKDVVFIIQNTIRKNIEPLQILKQEGFSTRGKNRGLGLLNVEEILLSEPNVLLETKISDTFFIQKVTILGEED